MRALILAAVIAALVLTAAEFRAGAAVEAPPVFLVKGPTVVAFFPPVSDSELADCGGLNETLSDFQQFADEVRGPFKKAGISFHETYTRSFTVRLKARAITFRTTRRNDVGYYFIAPGKKPRVEFDVMTNEDLLDVAHDYFGIPLPDDSQDIARELPFPLR
jgi:hypothetical protein